MSATPLSFALPLPQATRWRHATAALLLSVAAVLLLYRQSAGAMVEIWLRSDTFAHGFLVLPLVLWLVWRQRAALAPLVPQPTLRLLPLVLLLGLLWLAGELALVNALTQWCVVALMVLAVPVVLGVAVARTLLFPLCFMFFAVPLGEFLMPLLMDWTANFTIWALRLSGIPVYREGNTFVIPNGRWSVVEACSGVRYLIASFMVGTLFAYLSYRSYWRRAVFMGVALLVPVVANWVRAYFIVMLGYWSDNRIAAGVDHLLYGWLFFGVVIALMFMVGARWAEPEHAVAGKGARAVSATAYASARPGNFTQQLPHGVAGVWLASLAFVVLAALPQLALWALEQTSPAQPWPQDRMATSQADRHAQKQATTQTDTQAAMQAGTQTAPPALGERWPLLSGARPAFTPAYQTPAQVVQASYGTPAQAVGLYIGIYQQQRRGHTLVGSDNALLPSQQARWLLTHSGSQAVAVQHKTLTLTTHTLQPTHGLSPTDGTPLLVWKLYWVHGHVTASPTLAKAFGAWARLRGQRDDAAVLLAYTPQGVDGAGSAALSAFWADNFSTLDAWLQRATGGIPLQLQEGLP